jgi:hypothetical protein
MNGQELYKNKLEREMEKKMQVEQHKVENKKDSAHRKVSKRK